MVPLSAMRTRNIWRRAGRSAVVLLGLAPAWVAAQRAELEKVIRRRVLANGLEVIVAENHGVPLATVEINVRNGAFTQSPEYAGLAHMYEHMFFRANMQYPQSELYLDRASQLGAVFNGTTQEETVKLLSHRAGRFGAWCDSVVGAGGTWTAVFGVRARGRAAGGDWRVRSQ